MRAASTTNLELLAGFEQSEDVQSRAPGTRLRYLTCAMRFAQSLEARSMLDVDEDFLRAWLDARRPTWAASTDMHYRSTFHRFYSWALSQGLIEHDPAAGMMHVRRPCVVGDYPQLAHDYRVAMERRGLKATTVKTRLGKMRLIADHLAPRSLLETTAEDIERFLDRYRVSSNSRYTTISHLHMFFRWAERQGLVERDPTADIDRPRVIKGVPRPMSDEDLAAGIAQAPPPVGAMPGLAAFAGLRCQEVAGVHREDVLDQLQPPVLIVRDPKGHRQRILPLHPEAWRLLRAMGLPKSGAVFQVRSGGPGSRAPLRQAQPWYVSQQINAYLHSVGVTSTAHQARHWFGTSVYRQSLDLRLTQELMGHADPAMTALYAAFAPGKAADVVNEISPAASHPRA